MRRLIKLVFISLSFFSFARAQSVTTEPTATQTIQPSQSGAPVLQSQKTADPSESETLAKIGEWREVKLPSGTPIEVEAAYTVSSIDIKPGDFLSFRVLIPVIIEDVVVIDKGALVTARVILAKRGGHWGKAGRLAWSMEDVIGVRNTRIALAPETHVRNEASLKMETKSKNSETSMGQGRVVGASHGGEVATKAIVTAAIMPLFAPLALMQGFKRGENAVLPEGKRFVVLVRADTTVTTALLIDH